jgi:hypothetical protein
VTYKVLRRGPVVTGDPEGVKDIPFIGAQVTMIIDPEALKKHVEGDRPPSAVSSLPANEEPAPDSSRTSADGTSSSNGSARQEPASANPPSEDTDASGPGLADR